MLPPVVIGILFMVIAALAGATLNLKASATATRLAIKTQAQVAVAQAVKDYFLDTATVPANLSDMAKTVGYGHLRQYTSSSNAAAPGGVPGVTDLVTIAKSNSFTDALNSAFPNYLRVAVFSVTDASTTWQDYLAASRTINSVVVTNNKCSTSTTLDGYTNPAWCGDPAKGIWSAVTDRELFATQEATALAYQQVTADKFIVRYTAIGANTVNAFPAWAAVTPLYSVVASTTGSSPGTTRATCHGTFYWQPAPLTTQGIPLECTDLYNYFGNPVRYQKVAATNKQINLTSSSAFKLSDGATFRTLTTTVSMP